MHILLLRFCYGMGFLGSGQARVNVNMSWMATLPFHNERFLVFTEVLVDVLWFLFQSASFSGWIHKGDIYINQRTRAPCRISVRSSVAKTEDPALVMDWTYDKRKYNPNRI